MNAVMRPPEGRAKQEARAEYIESSLNQNKLNHSHQKQGAPRFALDVPCDALR